MGRGAATPHSQIPSDWISEDGTSFADPKALLPPADSFPVNLALTELRVENLVAFGNDIFIIAEDGGCIPLWQK